MVHDVCLHIRHHVDRDWDTAQNHLGGVVALARISKGEGTQRGLFPHDPSARISHHYALYMLMVSKTYASESEVIAWTYAGEKEPCLVST